MSSSESSSIPPDEENGPMVSRRAVLKAAGGTLATASAVAAVESTSQPARATAPAGLGIGSRPASSTGEIDPPNPEDLPNPEYGERQETYGEPGYPPIDAFHEVGRTELEKHKELGPPSYEQKLTPNDIGLSPGGSFSAAIQSANLDNAQLDLQGNTYKIDKQFTIRPSGSFKLQNGTLKIPEGVKTKFVIVAKQATLSHIIFDQTASGAAGEFSPQTDGSFQIINCAHKGIDSEFSTGAEQGANHGPLIPIAEGNGHIKFKNYVAKGGVQAAAHTQGNSCPNFSAGGGSFCYMGGHGSNETGTVDFVHCEVHNWQNAFYCSKTPMTIRVIGGKYVNNENGTLRIAAPPGATSTKRRSRGTGCTIYYNQKKWPKNQPGNPYKIGEIQGIQAMRSESEADALGPILDHIDVHAYNIKTNDCGNGGFNGLFEFKDDVGGSTIKNCRFTGKNIPPTPAVRAFAVGNEDPLKPKYGGKPPQPWGIQMSGLEIVGDFFDSHAIEMKGNRGPVSSIKNSCIKAASGPEAISGIPAENIKNVGYGPNCNKSQMPQGKVGAPGKINDIPDVSSSGVTLDDLNPLTWFQKAINHLMKGFAAIIVAPIIVLVLFLFLIFGPLFVVLIFIYAGRKALKK